MRIVAKLGVDMKAFLAASAIVGWAGLKPRDVIKTLIFVVGKPRFCKLV